MSEQDSNLPDIAYVSELARLFKRFRLDELEIETGDQRILMRRGAELVGAPMVAAAPTAMHVAAAAAPAPVAQTN